MAIQLISQFFVFCSVAGDESTTRLTRVISPARGVVEHQTPDLSSVPTGFTLQLVSLGALDLLSLASPFSSGPWRGNSTVTDRPMLRRNCLLLFLCFLFEQSSCAPFQSRPGQEWPHSQTGPSAAGRNAGSRGFQRVKRGWVWNQFFVLEEYMGSDPQYVGKVRSAFWTWLYFSCNTG